MAPHKPSASSNKGPDKKTLPPSRVEKRSKPHRAVKQIFRGKAISFSGDFGPGWSHEQMANWITLYGAEYEREVTADTNMLICTIEDYKKKNAQVKKALAMGKTRCSIVVKDWLEDCLIGNSRKRRCLKEKPYTLDRVLSRVGKTKQQMGVYRQNFEDGVKAAKEIVDSSLYRVYVDQTNFEYKIVCTRINTTGRVKTEKYTIYLWESLAKPHLYIAGAKLVSPGTSTSWHSKFNQFHIVFPEFKKFFEKRTGIPWDCRLDGLPQPEGCFRYTVPRLGRPVGLYPIGKRTPSWEEEDLVMKYADEPVADAGLIYDTESEVEDENPKKQKKSSKGQAESIDSEVASVASDVESIASEILSVNSDEPNIYDSLPMDLTNKPRAEDVVSISSTEETEDENEYEEDSDSSIEEITRSWG